jgi:hypothetical protein
LVEIDPKRTSLEIGNNSTANDPPPIVMLLIGVVQSALAEVHLSWQKPVTVKNES